MELGRWARKLGTGRERERQAKMGQVDRWEAGETEEPREGWLDG